MGGNIGTAILASSRRRRPHLCARDVVLPDRPDAVAAADVAVLLNISPDHLDRHGTMENYAAIKERLVAGPRTAVIGVDDEPASAAIAGADRSSGEAFARSRPSRAAGRRVAADRGPVVRDGRAIAAPVADLTGIRSLRGAHNAQNAAAASAVAARARRRRRTRSARHAHLPRPPAPHGGGRPTRAGDLRQQFQGHQCRFRPKRRSPPSSASTGLWAARRRRAASSRCRLYFPKIERAYLIGEAADEFAATLEGRFASTAARSTGRSPRPRRMRRARARGTGRAAVARLRLLRPVPEFRERGDHFRELVRALPGIEVKGL